MYGWGPDVIGSLTPKQLFAYTRATPGSGGKRARVGSVSEARNLCNKLRRGE